MDEKDVSKTSIFLKVSLIAVAISSLATIVPILIRFFG